MSEVRRQKIRRSEDQKIGRLEDGAKVEGQEDGRLRTEDGGRKTEDGGRRMEGSRRG